MTTRVEWVNDFLGRMGASPSTGRQEAILAQIAFEFGSLVPIPFAWNPCATTLREPGSSAGNPVGVQNYADEESGLVATVDTWHEDHGGYAHFRDVLVNSDDPVVICQAITDSDWGSKPGPAQLAWVQGNLAYHQELGVDAPHPGHQSGEPPAGPSGPATHVAMPQIAQGATGRPVEIVQKLLGADVDGQFGPQTDGYVRNFQNNAHIDADGIVGPITWTAILQWQLNATIDGIYGPETTDAVSTYQAGHGLTVDGIAGPDTFGRLAGLS